MLKTFIIRIINQCCSLLLYPATVAVLGTARPGAEKICRAPTPGKKFGPNIIFAFFLFREFVKLKFLLSLSITLFQTLFELCVYFIMKESIFFIL